MNASRFQMPVVGEPAGVRFPPVERQVLANGLRVWTTGQSAVPVVTLVFIVDAGTSADPADRHGLASLTSNVITEGAGRYDAIQLSDALARIGAQLSTEVGTDVASVTVVTLSRHFEAAVEILGDVVRRPRLEPADFLRVRDLRFGRLKQVGRTPAVAADRALLAAVYGNHPYGHGALGTTRSVERITLDDVRQCWSTRWQPASAALLVAGDVSSARAFSAAERIFGDWSMDHSMVPALAPPAFAPTRDVQVVNWPAAAQSEIRAGHLGPARTTPDYHALITLNAILGGLFTSRINRNLRETRAITYGARTAFEMRRIGGLFACDSSVQTDATAVALSETVREMTSIAQDDPVRMDELNQAKAALTRGYVRHFETAAQLARAMTELANHGLPADTYDRFVPGIEALTPSDITLAARTALHPGDVAMVAVGDLEKIRPQLESLGRPLVEVVPEF